MKKLLCVLILFGAFFSKAQEANDSIPFELAKQSFIYSMALKYNDPAVARMAIFNLIAYNPNSAQLIDTLSLLYFQYQQYASAAISAQDALSLNPDDLFATEIAALSFEKLGVKSRAVTYFEKLYLANNDLPTLYQVAFMQYELKRFGESTTNIDIILNDTRSSSEVLIFPAVNNKKQEVTMKAAAYRLKALVETEKGNKENAKQLLDMCLKLNPDFEVAKEELADLNKG